MHLLPRAAVLGALVLAACSAASTGGSPTTTPIASAGATAPVTSAQPSVAEPSASAAASEPVMGGSVVVTFRVVDEEYRVLVTDPNDITIALQLLGGDPLAPRIPNGEVVRGGDGGVNVGYSWHIDPDSLEFADGAIEVCDGRPSGVEAGTISGDRFCPWQAEVVAVDPA